MGMKGFQVTYSIRVERAGDCDEHRAGALAERHGRTISCVLTHREPTEVQRIDVQRVQQPGLWPVTDCVFHWQNHTQFRWYVFRVKVPHVDLVVPSMSTSHIHRYRLSACILYSSLLRKQAELEMQGHDMYSESAPCGMQGTNRQRTGTYVTIRCSPHGAVPSSALSWAFQTARGRLVVTSHMTTQPSASALRRRVF